MTNRLARETSPYLLQHKDNPVDWFPWGDEAFAKAKTDDKPLLVSVGYSACHWCHVMAHESFENWDTAQLMNQRFVNVKVDREERPDVDSILMTAVQAMSGQGGWPLNVFLTPDGVPFYGGTYWPPQERQGMPKFADVLTAVSEAYRNNRDGVLENAEQIRAFLRQSTAPVSQRGELNARVLDRATRALESQFDDTNGGFGASPKFPQPAVLDFLLRQSRLHEDQSAGEMALMTLRAMAAGGVYDQIGGGFHRYSVDASWLVPHFEKMLYDNAQLAGTYTDGYRLFGDAELRRTAEEILDYLLREMRNEHGGFYATQDADSEGEEGVFYTWRPDEIDLVAGDVDGPVVRAYWGVSARGNFEGANILNRPVADDEAAEALTLSEDELRAIVDRVKPKLYEARARREWPGRDEKVIAGWNGMALRAFAEAARSFDRPDYLAAAEKTASFLLTAMSPDGRLMHVWNDGATKIDAFLDDYALTIDGLISLYEASFDVHWFDEAARLAKEMIARFGDPEGAGMFDTADTPDHLVARPRDLHDGATPSGNAAAAAVLLRLSRFTGDPALQRRGWGILEMLVDPMSQQPTGFGRYLTAAATALATPRELAIAGTRGDPDVEGLAAEVFRRFEPAMILGLAESGDAAARMPFLEHRSMRDGKATAYVCERFACLPPVTDPADLAIQLEQGTLIEWKAY